MADKLSSQQKINDILDWVQNTRDVDWGFMCCLKQDLEQLVIIAQTEGIKEAQDALNKVWDNTLK